MQLKINSVAVSFLILISFVHGGDIVYAQNNKTTNPNPAKDKVVKESPQTKNNFQKTDTLNLPKDPISLPANYDKELEQLIKSWHKGYTQGSTLSSKKGMTYNPDGVRVADSVYISRLEKLPSVVKMTYNPIVKECIELYLNRNRSLVSSMLTVADLYFPDIEALLDRNGLPIELKYLTIIESGLNPKAVSHMGASGLWQFMLPTAKAYGLTVNSLVDERLCPKKSSEAAMRYFKDMYRIYGDWLLVIAAYNCGPGAVNRAINRAGGATDFWQIYPYLPRETRRYVPLFMGAYYSMVYYKEHNIKPREAGVPLATDTVMITKDISFDRIQKLSGISRQELEMLNPQYKRGIVPGNSTPYPVRLPLAAALNLDMRKDSLYSDELKMVLEDPINYQPFSDNKSTPSKSKGKTIDYHTVKKGETLGGIARKYKQKLSKIKSWNGLKSNNLQIGQRLKVR